MDILSYHTNNIKIFSTITMYFELYFIHKIKPLVITKIIKIIYIYFIYLFFFFFFYFNFFFFFTIIFGYTIFIKIKVFKPIYKILKILFKTLSF